MTVEDQCMKSSEEHLRVSNRKRKQVDLDGTRPLLDW